MNVELPGFEFETAASSRADVMRLFDKVRKFLDKAGVASNEYSIGIQPTAGLGELIIQTVNNYWLVFTAERGVNYDIAIFTNKFFAINYFIFRLTSQNETIDWSEI